MKVVLMLFALNATPQDQPIQVIEYVQVYTDSTICQAAAATKAAELNAAPKADVTGPILETGRWVGSCVAVK